MKRKLLRLIPFLILAAISIYTLIEFIFTAAAAEWRHYLAFGLFALDTALYFYRFRPAVLGTGIILILGTFNLLSFFSETKTFWFGIAGIQTPEMQLSMLGLLVLYGFLNFHFLVEWYLDIKYGPADKNV